MLILRFRCSIAAALVGGVLGLGSTASAAPPLGEQVDRATGFTGSTALNSADATPRAISDDGRTAIFDYRVSTPNDASVQDASARALSGVYVRDTVADTTRQLVVDNATTTGVTDDFKTISVLTKRALVSADTNGAIDLYLVDVATGAATLVPTGGGDAVVGAITRDGSAVVWSTSGGTWRQPIAGGTAVKLSDRSIPEHSFASVAPLGGGPWVEGFLVDHAVMSFDGRAAIVAGPPPFGSSRVPYSVVRAGGASLQVGDTGTLTQRPWISGDGSTAVGTNNGAILVADLSAHTVAEIAVGQSPELDDVSADGRGVVLAIGSRSVRKVDVPSKTVTDIAPASGWNWSRVLSASLTFELGAAGHLWAVPIASTPLPETPDAPSALSYLSFRIGCTMPSNQIAFLPTRPTIGLTQIPGLMPSAKSASLVIHAANGALVGGKPYVLTATGTTSASLPIGWVGGWTLDATVTFADGRWLTSHWVQPHYTTTPVCQFML